ncbi:MAG: 50S ribosomal protein L17 [Patescibacteria group bacterium]|nr:50S ribosomal protein L17 [Patescibacteria group bacterium]
MRHQRAHRKLGRVKRVRTALLRSLARSLILEEGITTTVAKAKELRPFVERLVTSGKESTLASRRRILRQINDAEAVNKITGELAKRYESRHGGYTRVTLLGRVGKRTSESARIEFVK